MRLQIDAGPALRYAVEAERERLQHARQAEHADGKEWPLEPQHRTAKRQRGDRPGESGSDRGQIPGDIPVKDQERSDIRTNPEKADLTEMGVTRVAPDQVPGIGKDQEDHRLDRERHRVVGPDQRQNSGGDKRNGEDAERAQLLHIRTPAPSSPRGRTRRTPSISRKRNAEPITAPAK
jgi:hypothetical protein